MSQDDNLPGLIATMCAWTTDEASDAELHNAIIHYVTTVPHAAEGSVVTAPIDGQCKSGDVAIQKCIRLLDDLGHYDLANQIAIRWGTPLQKKHLISNKIRALQPSTDGDLP